MITYRPRLNRAGPVIRVPVDVRASDVGIRASDGRAVTSKTVLNDSGAAS